MTTSIHLNAGIYAIENVINDTVYLGQAIDVEKRWRQHVLGLNKRTHFNRLLQADWNKYGQAAFKFSVLEYCAVETLTEREQHYLDIHVSTGYCYNIARNVHTPAKGSRGALFENSLSRFSNEEMLVLLNEYKTVDKVAKIIGTSMGTLFLYLQRNGFKKVVTYRYFIAETK